MTRRGQGALYREDGTRWGLVEYVIFEQEAQAQGRIFGRLWPVAQTRSPFPFSEFAHPGRHAVLEMENGERWTLFLRADGHGRDAGGIESPDTVSRGGSRAPSPPAGDPRPAPDPSRILEGVRVLAVEDDDDVREVIAAMLEGCGATVESVSSAQAAMGALRREVPDVLIADIGLSGEDGYSLIRDVRALPEERGGKIRAVALTGHGTPEDAERARESGYTVHLPKPAYPAEVVSLVARLVGR